MRDYPDGATPLDPDEAAGLKLTHITTREALDRWEQDNIHRADAWATQRRRPVDALLSEDFLRELHRRMFGDVWRWAGRYRTSDKNIGVPREQLVMELRNLCDDTKAWISHQCYPADEIALRFHHRLVKIHPFANGNGRHARLMTDVLLEQVLQRPRFTWGSENLTDAGECRQRYIAALQAADRRDYALLAGFVRS